MTYHRCRLVKFPKIYALNFLVKSLVLVMPLSFRDILLHIYSQDVYAFLLFYLDTIVLILFWCNNCVLFDNVT